MHELSLCLSMVELIEQQARQHQARRVIKVWIEIGALACIEEQALRFSFASATRDTVAEGCELILGHQAAKAWCWDCCQEVTVETHGSACLECGSYALRIESGESLRLRQLEVE